MPILSQWKASSTSRGALTLQGEISYCRNLISFLFMRKRSKRTNFHANARTRMIIRDGWPRARARREKKERTRNILSSILWEVKGWVLYIPLAEHRGLSKWSVEELCQHECEQVKVTRALNCATTKSRHRANLSEWTSDGLWWYHGGWTKNGDRI